ncbi:uncharacterized protein LOC132044971 [Lycium ferocissimum]|uniref:uncharacterized protein LOC132044971 n=1 Tax=Lycium ferocissimum TaxID=112874 RepID=UPI002815C5CF|nr:uncharacterized protein LOC132044971 [Lycium ferocissimum]
MSKKLVTNEEHETLLDLRKKRSCLSNKDRRDLNYSSVFSSLSPALHFSSKREIQDFRRAAESLEKLMDVTREELPDTMAAVRLSSMEITMELSDTGQGYTRF